MSLWVIEFLSVSVSVRTTEVNQMMVQHRELVHNAYFSQWWFVRGSGPWEVVSKGKKVEVNKLLKLSLIE